MALRTAHIRFARRFPTSGYRHCAVRGVVCLLLLTLLVNSGCVRRRLTIRSDPPGAMVAIDQQEIGTTPVSVGYTFYGTRNFVITKDNHETVSASRTFRPPWYQYPPLDFITENLWPFELRDERVVDFQLIPSAQVQTEALVSRGEQLRNSARSGVVVPLPDFSAGAPVPEVAPLPAPATMFPAPPVIMPPR